MNTQKISALEFVDLYIGEEYCDIKGLAGASASRVGAPDELKDQINALRQQCQVIYRAQQEPEFALILDGVLFRVTQIRMCSFFDARVRKSGRSPRLDWRRT